MWILIELIAAKDQSIDIMQYHKLQGFIYRNLINKSPFKGLHDLKTYKYYCYSNIFPPSPARIGDKRFLIFSTPSIHLINFIFDILKEFKENNTEINIGGQSYTINSVKMLKKLISHTKRNVVITSTPITVRLSEKGYSKYYVPIKLQKKKFISGR